MSDGARRLVVRTGSPGETEAVGEALVRSLTAGAAGAGPVFVSLEGPLGSGKTVLVRGACRALGVSAPVTSPTYTLANEYEGEGGRRVVHLDCFRLEGARELEDLGLEDRLDAEAVVLVEWGDRVLAALPFDVLRVVLEPDPDGDDSVRRVSILLPEGVRLPGLEPAA